MRPLNLALRFLVILAAATLGIAGTALALVPQLARLDDATSGTPKELDLNKLAERSTLFDRSGNQVTTFNLENRVQVPLSQVPETVKDSVLAVEDSGFYTHSGVNLKATVRALFADVASGGVEQGGSTITQQVIKNSVLGTKQEAGRKVKEAILARRLEKQMTKDQILERYLNTIYLANNVYGVQAAAETYFGKNVQDLDWPQAALLAAMIRNPNGYEPIANPNLAIERRSLALDRLVEVGDITSDQADQYSTAPIPTALLQPIVPKGDYFSEEVKQQILNDPTILSDSSTANAEALFSGGLRIYTTYDPTLQADSLSARDDTLPDGAPSFDIPNPDGRPCSPGPAGTGCFGTLAMTSVEPSTGAVRSIIGPGFDQFKYDIATHKPGRQPGSTFKVFVMLAAYEAGFVPDDRVDGDTGCRVPQKGQTPHPFQNSDETKENGFHTITDSLAQSINCAFIRLGQVVGLDKVIDMAHKLGINVTNADGNENPVPSLPLGVTENTPLQIASAYAAIADEGIYNPPYFIDKITDSSGKVLYEHKPNPSRAFSVQTARLAEESMQQTFVNGTASKARPFLDGRPAAGKTGTTNEHTNAWFTAITPQLAASCWMGSPDLELPLHHTLGQGANAIFGGTFCAPIVAKFLTSGLDGQPDVGFAGPEPTRGGLTVNYDDNTGKGSLGGSASSTPGSNKGGSGGNNKGGKTTTTKPKNQPQQPPQPTDPQPPVTPSLPVNPGGKGPGIGN